MRNKDIYHTCDVCMPKHTHANLHVVYVSIWSKRAYINGDISRRNNTITHVYSCIQIDTGTCGTYVYIIMHRVWQAGVCMHFPTSCMSLPFWLIALGSVPELNWPTQMFIDLQGATLHLLSAGGDPVMYHGPETAHTLLQCTRRRPCLRLPRTSISTQLPQPLRHQGVLMRPSCCGWTESMSNASRMGPEDFPPCRVIPCADTDCQRCRERRGGFQFPFVGTLTRVEVAVRDAALRGGECAGAASISGPMRSLSRLRHRCAAGHLHRFIEAVAVGLLILAGRNGGRPSTPALGMQLVRIAMCHDMHSVPACAWCYEGAEAPLVGRRQAPQAVAAASPGTSSSPS